MTREEILLAAAQLFGDKGFHGASMQEVADSVKLQKASLYHHVSSKQDLLVQILDMALDHLIDQLEAIVQSNLLPEEKLRSSVITYLEELAENPKVSAVLLLEHNSLEPKYRDEHIKRRDQFEKLWLSIIEEGVASGEFHCFNAGLATKSLLGMMNWTVTWYRNDGALSIQAIAEYFVNFVLGGVGYQRLDE